MNICGSLGVTESTTCASWIQAWGSIGAILVAVLIAFVQHRQNLRLQHRITADRDRQAVVVPLAIADRGLAKVAALRAVLISTNTEKYGWGAPTDVDKEMTEFVELLNSISIQTLPTYETVMSMQMIVDAFRNCARLLELMVHSKNSTLVVNKRHVEELDAMLNVISFECTNLRCYIEGKPPRFHFVPNIDETAQRDGSRGQETTDQSTSSKDRPD